MVITIIKLSFKKLSPIERHYRDYKYYDQTKFESNLNEKLREGISNYESFETTFIKVLNKHAPSRKKFIRANHASYITKSVRKTILRRQNISELKLKPTSNCTQSIKHSVVIYAKGKEENTTSP